MLVLKKSLLFVLAGLIVATSALAIVPSPKASAASNYTLISNDMYLNKNTMTQAQIQSFLASKNSSLATYKDKGVNDSQPQLASTIIYNAAKSWGINPQVLLATMQKEQSLVTKQNPTSIAYRSAMGYGCPDGANCNAVYYGFANQVNIAAYQFRYNYEALRKNSSFIDGDGDVHGVGAFACAQADSNHTPPFYNAPLLSGNTVTFGRNAAIAGTSNSTVVIGNEATASLLCYTPHVGPYGTTGYSGSDNFTYWFTQWFGSPFTPPPTKCDSKLSGIVCVWSVKKGDGSQFLTTSESELNNAMYGYGWANEGIIFYASSSQTQGAIPVHRMRRDNLHYYSVDAQEYASLKDNGAWVDEGIRFYELPNSASTNISHRVYKLYNSSTGNYFWTRDGDQKNYLLNSGYSVQINSFNSLSGRVPTSATTAGRDNIYSLKNGNTYLYSTNLIEVESAIESLGYQYTGLLTTANAANTGTPVYRLQGQGDSDFLYTTDVTEKNNAVSKYGYRDQGIRFYVDASSDPVYRIIGTTTASTHRYVSSLQDVMSLANKGWRYEKMLLSSTASTVPVLRFFGAGEHFYTTNIAEAAAISNNGYAYERPVFNAQSTPTGTTTPVYRLYGAGEHFYTTDVTEKNNAVSKYGYIDEGIRFYASSVPTSIPVYRLYGAGEHFYTTDVTEKNNAVSKYGYIDEGIRFYLAS